jgi:hypothetical protein
VGTCAINEISYIAFYMISFIAQLIVKVLTSAGFTVTIAEDGDGM